MFKEFKQFVARGNVLDLAVAVIMGAAFGPIVTSLVNDLLMPPIGLIVGKVDFANLFINLSSTHYATLKEAKAAGAPTLNYGLFLNTVVNFVIIAFVVFLIVQQVNRMKKPEPASPPTTKDCPLCLSTIPMGAKKCSHCTADLPAPA